MRIDCLTDLPPQCVNNGGTLSNPASTFKESLLIEGGIQIVKGRTSYGRSYSRSAKCGFTTSGEDTFSNADGTFGEEFVFTVR